MCIRDSRKLTRAADLFVGKTLYGHLPDDSILPPFSAVVMQIT